MAAASPAVHVQNTDATQQYIFREIDRTPAELKMERDVFAKIIRDKASNFYYCINDVIFMATEDVTAQQSVNKIFLPTYFSGNLNKLTESFTKENEKYGHLITMSSEDVKDIFEDIASKLSMLPFEKCNVELTKSQSIKISLLFSGDKLLVITKPLIELDSFDNNNIICNYFINRELIMSDVSNTKSLVEGFNRYLEM